MSCATLAEVNGKNNKKKRKKKEQNKNKHVMPPLTPTLKLVLWPSLQNRTSKGRKHTYQALKVTRDSEQSTNSTLRKSEGMNSFFFFSRPQTIPGRKGNG